MKIKDWIEGLVRSDKASPTKTESPVIAKYPIVFRLIYQNNEIGTLKFTGNKWVFFYSEWFKGQSDIKPFANFPDVDRQEYVSDELPPFFESRLPGISQPQVEAFLEDLKSDKKINEGDTKVELLKKFGRRTITNPFELQPAF